MRRTIHAIGLGCLVVLANAAAVHAATCDVPLVISHGGGQAGVLIILDNSASMNEAICADAYDPKVTYKGGKFSASQSYDIHTSGTYSPKSFNNKWGSTPTAYLVTSDKGEAGVYDGNYLNWIFYIATATQRAAIPTVTRIQMAKQAVNTVLGTTSNCLFGLMTFNTSGSDGGTLVDSIGASVSKIQTDVTNIRANTYTPLAETMVDSLDYFATTGAKAPIKADCQKSFVIIATDGYPTKDLNVPAYLRDYDGDGKDPGNCTTLGTGYSNSLDCSDYLDDVAAYMYRNDLRPDMDGMQNVATFVVGMNINAPILQETADNGGGEHYIANNVAGLTAALSEAFTTIEKRISAGASVSVVSSEDRTNNRLFRARYESETWRGFVESFALPYHSGDHALWEAGQLLADRNPDARTILTSLNGTSAVALTAANAATLRTALGAADVTEATNIIQYVRGNAITGTRDRGGWKLGDIVDSAPAVAGKPVGFNNLPGYNAFRAAHANRQEVLYVGGNDGMLHCFSTTDGTELWAYAPKNVLVRLKDLMSTTYCHEYYVNLTPVVYDVYVGGAWKTLVIGGEERGGNGLFALDVTDPDPAAVSVLWDVDLPALKGSWNPPTLVRDRTLNRQVLCVGTGYDATTSSASLLVIDPANGSVLSNTTLGSAYAGNKTTKATTIDMDFDGYDDKLYLGDLAGRIWRVDMTRNPWNFSVLFNSGKPIQAAPVITVDALNRPMVFFGTGSYLTATDLASMATQSIYGIIDDGTGATVLASNLVDQTTSFHPMTGGTRGWFVDLTQHAGERVTRSPSLVAGTLYAPSFLPNTTVCSGGGQSWLYSLDYKDGSAPDHANGTSNNTVSGRVESMGDGIMADPSVDLVNETLILQSSNAVLLTHSITGGLQKLAVRAWRQRWN
jgi:type IV pilus assembly protein PilY1